MKNKRTIIFDASPRPSIEELAAELRQRSQLSISYRTQKIEPPQNLLFGKTGFQFGGEVAAIIRHFISSSLGKHEIEIFYGRKSQDISFFLQTASPGYLEGVLILILHEYGGKSLIDGEDIKDWVPEWSYLSYPEASASEGFRL